MRTEGSCNTQNDTLFVLSVKQRRNERKKFAFQAKVEEIEAQNNKIAMKNEIIQEHIEKLFEMLHEGRQTQSHEPITHVNVNHHLGAPPTWRVTNLQHGYS
ncbi:hypothetical protein EV1_018823 [Malus domestica]